MKPLYICSVRPYSGKSLLAIGIGMNMQKTHPELKVGFYKPVGTIPTKVEGVWTEQDAVLSSRLLGQEIALERICSVVMTPDLVNRAFKGKFIDKMPNIRKDFEYVRSRCGFLIMEGAQDLFIGSMIGIPAYLLMNSLDVRMVVVNRFEGDLDAETILAVKHFLGEDFIGVIFNNVNRAKVSYLERLVVPMLRRNGVEVFGIIPSDRVMSSVSAGEAAEILGGEVLCCKDHLDRMAENIAIGAMSLDQAYERMKKIKDKIVIVGGDRTDILLAALETDTAAVVLTGGLYPNDIILGKADDVDIPLIRVDADTFTVVDRLHDAMGQLRLDNEKKIRHGVNLVSKRVDFELLENALKD